MQKIFPEINPGQQGKEVSTLQDALIFLVKKEAIALAKDEYEPNLHDLEEEQNVQQFGKTTEFLVKLFQAQNNLNNKEGVVDNETAGKLNEVLKQLGAYEDTEKDTVFIVKGFIYKATGEGYTNITVAAFDCDLRRRELLGESRTDEKGYYEIKYDLQTFIRNEKGNADIKIIAQDLKKQLTKKSEIYFNATTVQEINLTFPSLPHEKEKSDWEIINEQVLPLLKGQRKIEEKKTIKYEDLSPIELTGTDIYFIAKETGLDINNIQLWPVAYSRNKEVNSIAPEIFYGWFRMGLPKELKELWSKNNDELILKLNEAVSKNIIPALSDELQRSLDALANIKVEFYLQPAKEGDKASIGDVLNTAGKDWLSNEKKKSYIEIAKGLDPDSEEDFNKKIDAIGFKTDEKNTLQKTLRLDKLTLSHPPLMEALQTYVRTDTDASLKPLATIHRDQWIDLAYTHGVPAGSKLTPEDYAIQLSNAVEDRLPTASLTSKVFNGEILFDQPGIEKIEPLLKGVTDFDIAKDDIAYVAVKHKLDDDSKNLLITLQNFKKTGLRWDDVSQIMSMGIISTAEDASLHSLEYWKALLENKKFIQNFKEIGLRWDDVSQIISMGIISTAEEVSLHSLEYWKAILENKKFIQNFEKIGLSWDDVSQIMSMGIIATAEEVPLHSLEYWKALLGNKKFIVLNDKWIEKITFDKSEAGYNFKAVKISDIKSISGLKNNNQFIINLQFDSSISTNFYYESLQDYLSDFTFIKKLFAVCN